MSRLSTKQRRAARWRNRVIAAREARRNEPLPVRVMRARFALLVAIRAAESRVFGGA